MVSFDVLFQGFIAGESSERGGAEMRQVLVPYVTERRGSFLVCELATETLTSTSTTTG